MSTTPQHTPQSLAEWALSSEGHDHGTRGMGKMTHAQRHARHYQNVLRTIANMPLLPAAVEELVREARANPCRWARTLGSQDDCDCRLCRLSRVRITGDA